MRDQTEPSELAKRIANTLRLRGWIHDHDHIEHHMAVDLDAAGLRDLIRERDEARAAAAELQADRERMDWLSANVYRVPVSQVNSWWIVNFQPEPKYATLREALDAARGQR